jgi:DNA-binding MarR family transcriptional regulator
VRRHHVELVLAGAPHPPGGDGGPAPRPARQRVARLSQLSGISAAGSQLPGRMDGMTNRGETSGHTRRLRGGDLGTLMRTGYHRTMEYVQARLEQLGFDDVRPAHMAIFQNLGPEGARIGELAERAKLTNQSVGYLVDYLEEHGYVERRPDPTNRRATLVCFTERGWDEADACAKILDQLDEELTTRMGAERLEQLQALLAEATAALRASKSAV